MPEQMSLELAGARKVYTVSQVNARIHELLEASFPNSGSKARSPTAAPTPRATPT